MNINFEIYNEKINKIIYESNKLTLITNNYYIKFNDYIDIYNNIDLLLNNQIKKIKKIELPLDYKFNISNNYEIIYLSCYELSFNNSYQTFKIIAFNKNKFNLTANIYKKN